MARSRIVLVGVAAAVTPALGCGGSAREEVTVFAASSLVDVFEEIAVAYESQHPDVDVVVSPGGSSSLAAQIENGAPADVFAAADVRSMERVLGAVAVAEQPQVFAVNRLAIAVEAGNPLGIAGLGDLVDDRLVVVLAAAEVPAGGYANEILTRAGVDVQVDSSEQSVRAVATKIALGEADVGLVYRTDVLASAGELTEVAIPDAVNVRAEYPIVALGSDDVARDVVAFVLGDAGRAALADAGFELP